MTKSDLTVEWGKIEKFVEQNKARIEAMHSPKLDKKIIDVVTIGFIDSIDDMVAALRKIRGKI